jgi:hypothetical protein
VIGWIFWDPGAIERYTALGLPGPLGYVAARAAPLGPAGNEAVIAAFSTIRPEFIALALDEAREQTTWEAVWEARDEAVVEGLRAFVPASCEAIARMGPWLWDAVDECPLGGRVFFGAHLRMPRPEDPLLSAWHAVNCLREWRGDTHLAILASEGLDAVEGSILHNAWVGYEGDWVAASRGWDDESIGAAYRRLESRGLAVAGAVTEAGLSPVRRGARTAV